MHAHFIGAGEDELVYVNFSDYSRFNDSESIIIPRIAIELISLVVVGIEKALSSSCS